MDACFYPGALYAAVRMGKSPVAPAFAPAEIDAMKLLGFWVALTLASVAVSMRQDYYSMSCWGPVAAFLVFPWTMRQSEERCVPRGFLVIPCVLVALGGGTALVYAVESQSQLLAFGNALASPIATRDTFMDALSGISPALWGKLIILLAMVGAVMLPAGSIAALLYVAASPQPCGAFYHGRRDGGAHRPGDAGLRRHESPTFRSRKMPA